MSPAIPRSLAGMLLLAAAHLSRLNSCQILSRQRGADMSDETVLDFRGRDLALIPPVDIQALPTAVVLNTLFGPHLPADLRDELRRDKRAYFLRTKPIHYAALKQAL